MKGTTTSITAICLPSCVPLPYIRPLGPLRLTFLEANMPVQRTPTVPPMPVIVIL